MTNWKKFELECVDYLNQRYGEYFEHLGFSDSTKSDIQYSRGEKTFFIEVKMPSAQSGQFVLLPDRENRKFIFSPRNKSELDDNVQSIINHMNNHFDLYENVGTEGEEINLSQELFSNWIINNYKKQGVKFFITKGKDFIVFPIKNYSEYFEISCIFRIKKSGSSNVPKKRQKEVLLELQRMNFDFKLIDDFKIKTHDEVDNLRFSVNDTDYMVKKFNENIYRIRKLSNTHNPNVIFSINLIKEQEMKDLREFEMNL